MIVSGGIAAYRSLDLIRRLRECGAEVRCVLTAGGARFVTALSLAALSEDKVYDDLFSLTDESEMGHLRLSREADLVVVAPASADLLAKMASGLTNDLASTVLLATDKPVLVAPAMNVRMWEHPATRANVATLEDRGVHRVGPAEGALADGEYGMGRLAEVPDIVAAIDDLLGAPEETSPPPLGGRRALITSGPTYEAIDPVRYIANRSSGKQGHATAAALARLGAETVLVSGPTLEADPTGVAVIHVDSAQEMFDACMASLPVDLAVCAAAVADWRVVEPSSSKLKKENNAPPPSLKLAPNPDILTTLAGLAVERPELVIGFAAETENVVENGIAKRHAKGCDWIVANDVSARTGTFGGDENTIHLITGDGNGTAPKVESWPTLSKTVVAERLAQRIAEHFAARERA